MSQAQLDDLKEKLSFWLNRSDSGTTDRFDDFITFGEERLMRDAKFRDFRTTQGHIIAPSATDEIYYKETFGSIDLFTNASPQVTLQNLTHVYHVKCAEAEEYDDPDQPALTTYRLNTGEDVQFYPALTAVSETAMDALRNGGGIGSSPQPTRYSTVTGLAVPSHFCINAKNSLQFWPVKAPYYVQIEFNYGYLRLVDSVAFGDATIGAYSNHPELWLYSALSEACLYLRDNEQASVWESKYQQAIELYNRNSQESEISGSTRIMGSPYAV